MEVIPYEILATTVVVILAACGAIVMVVNAIKAIREMRKPQTDQTNLVMTHDEKLLHDYKDIQELKKEVRIILECLRPMLQHLINGDDIESLKEKAEFLDRYLINLIER